MSTRHATEGSAFRQERYSSSPALETGLNGVLVKNRCATLRDPHEIELAWFIQYQSMQQGALEKFAADLLAEFPERVGTPVMRQLALDPGERYGVAQVRSIRDEARRLFRIDDFPIQGDSRFGVDIYSRFAELPMDEPLPDGYPASDFFDLCKAKFLKVVPWLLTDFCLDPMFTSGSLEVISDDAYRIPIFDNLRGALVEFMQRWERRHLPKIAQTKIGEKVVDAMEYSEAERALVLIEGVYGTGKTWPSKVWCEARPGKRRYVQCPSSNNNIDFFRTIAEPLGVSNALSMKAHQMQARINDVLQAGHLTLVMDESHYLFPQASTRVALPGRVNWVRPRVFWKVKAGALERGQV